MIGAFFKLLGVVIKGTTDVIAGTEWKELQQKER